MSAADLINALQTLNAGIAGVQSAPQLAAYPPALAPGNLPCAITLLADDDWTKHGQTDFMITVYVAPVGAGTFAQAQATGLALHEAFRQAYRATRSVGGQPVMPSHHTARGGFGSMGFFATVHYAGQEYFGFTARIPIQDAA